MARILFVDDRPQEILRLWQCSGCESNHELLPLAPFNSLEETRQSVRDLCPDVVVVGYGLGKLGVTGADIIQSLREGGYIGCIIANSGGGRRAFDRTAVAVDGYADRNPHELKRILDQL